MFCWGGARSIQDLRPPPPEKIIAAMNTKNGQLPLCLIVYTDSDLKVQSRYMNIISSSVTGDRCFCH